MPTLIIGGFKFRFYSSDINEPPHVHVLREESIAKIWLNEIEMEYNRGYDQPTLNRILKLTRENRERLMELWNEYFNK